MKFSKFIQYATCILLTTTSSLTLAPSKANAQVGAGVVSSQFVYESAPFPSCHASTIAETRDGQLVVAFFGGTDEKDPDVGVWVSLWEKDHWSAPREVANGVQYVNFDGTPHRHPCWNPVLFQPTEGPLLLFYKVGPSPDTWWGMMTSSEDNGKSWSTPRRLPERIDGPVKNKPIELADGSLLCPSSTEDNGWRIHMERTSDQGITWSRSGPLNDGKSLGAIQPSILKLKDNRLLALGRTQQGFVFSTRSDDQGQTWSPLTLTKLPNPNAGTDAVTLNDGRHVLVYNHTPRGRSPLNVALSNDGEDWQGAVILENAPGEYSYPAVIQTKDNRIHITYTWKREKIRHVVLDPSQLETRDMNNGRWPRSL